MADVLLAEGDQIQRNVALVRIEIPRAMADGQNSLAAIRVGLDVRAATVASPG